MIANSTTLRLTFPLSQWWYSDKLPNFYIKVSYTCTIIGFIAESTLKFINDTRYKFFGMRSLKQKVFANFFWLLKALCSLQESVIYSISVRHLNVRSGEHIRILLLTKKKVKPKGGAVSDHLFLCNNSTSFESFSVLVKEKRKFVSELKESLLIMRDKPSLNKNIRSAPFYLFNRI